MPMTKPKENQRLLHFQWSDFDIAVKAIADAFPNIKEIYGIPRGGLVLAVALSNLLDKPLVQYLALDKRVLVVDDICDTGKTLSRYRQLSTASIYTRHNSSFMPNFSYRILNTDQFVVFPWEYQWWEVK